MAAAVLAALLLLQSPSGTYRTGPATTDAYRTGPAPAAAPYQTGPTSGANVWSPTEPASAQGPSYSIAPDAILLRPRLRATGVLIDRYDPRLVEGFRAPEDRAYEATILGGAAAAQGRQGSLDGAWDLSGQSGAALYGLQLAQAADGEPVEGAWRNVAAAGGARVSGFVLAAQEPGRLTLRFFEPGDTAAIVVTLQPAIDGTWRGEMVRDGVTSAVVMRRR